MNFQRAFLTMGFLSGVLLPLSNGEAGACDCVTRKIDHWELTIKEVRVDGVVADKDQLDEFYRSNDCHLSANAWLDCRAIKNEILPKEILP